MRAQTSTGWQSAVPRKTPGMLDIAGNRPTIQGGTNMPGLYSDLRQRCTICQRSCIPPRWVDCLIQGSEIRRFLQSPRWKPTQRGEYTSFFFVPYAGACILFHTATQPDFILGSTIPQGIRTIDRISTRPSGWSRHLAYRHQTVRNWRCQLSL